MTDINAKYDNSPLSKMNSKNWLDSCNFILTSNSAQFAKHLFITCYKSIIQCPCLGIFCTIQLPTHLNRNILQKRKSNNNQTFFFQNNAHIQSIKSSCLSIFYIIHLSTHYTWTASQNNNKYYTNEDIII